MTTNHLKEDILQATDNGRNVFSHYLGLAGVHEMTKPFKNPFYEDTKASCSVFKGSDGIWRMKDFGNSDYCGDCFWLVAVCLNVDVRTDFIAVILDIVNELHLNIDTTVLELNTNAIVAKDNKVKEAPAEEFPFEGCASSDLQYKTKDFTAEELAYWDKYGISENILKEFNVYSVSSYEGVSSKGKKFELKSKENEPIFLYRMNDYVKLYMPLSKVRFIYGGKDENVNHFFCHPSLLEDDAKRNRIIFITGGEKDVMTLHAHGFDAVCFSSETADIPERELKALACLYEYVCILYDVDSTGLKAAADLCRKFQSYNVLNITLPLNGDKTHKDISDYFLEHSSDDFKAFLSKYFKNRRTFSSLRLSRVAVLRLSEYRYLHPQRLFKENDLVVAMDLPCKLKNVIDLNHEVLETDLPSSISLKISDLENFSGNVFIDDIFFFMTKKDSLNDFITSLKCLAEDAKLNVTLILKDDDSLYDPNDLRLLKRRLTFMNNTI